MNECKGGCSSVMGCAESKRKKQERGRANGPGLELGLGRFGSGWERVYKGFETHFLSFLKIFLSLPFSNSRFSLFMCSRTRWCSSFCSFQREVSGGSGGGWPAGAAAPPRRNPRLYFLNFFFRLISSTPFSDLISYLKITNKYATPPRSKEQKK